MMTSGLARGAAAPNREWGDGLRQGPRGDSRGYRSSPELVPAPLFRALVERYERELQAREASECRLTDSIERLTQTLLQVVAGNLEVHIERDYQGDSVDVLAFLINTTISELRWRAANSLELTATAADLEARVAERTHALQVAHDRLQQELADLNVLQAQWREQATRDPLTHLFNRRYLLDGLEREIARARREGSGFSLVMLDLDDFKQVNDTFGHLAGDAVLRTLSDLLLAGTRGADIACRMGGEEFVLVLPGTSWVVAHKRAEQLRLQFAQARTVHAGRTLSATFSAGVASFPAHGESVEAVLNCVDRALYQAKQAGRNRVVAWNPRRLGPPLATFGHSLK